MNERKKKARPTAATVEQAEGNVLEQTYSRNHSNPKGEKNQPPASILSIFELLPTGEECAISRSELCAITGLNIRNLRALIHKERCDGLQILTNTRTGGYYKPGNTDETLHFIRSMRRRAAETSAVADAVERAMMDEAGQTRIGGV